MATIPFSQMPSANSVSDAAIIPIVQTGINQTVTANVLKAYVNSSSYGNANVAAFLPTNTANVAANYFLGNGSQLTGIASSYGNANVAAYLPTNTANVRAGNVSATGNVTGTYILGDGSLLSNLPAGNYSNANVSAYLPTNSSNVAANFFLGNGSLLTNLPAGNYSNANVASYLPTYTGNISGGNLSVTGRVIGNGASLTNVVTSIVAGSGISINQSTGAVTITNTGGGGGGGTSIVNGTSSVNIANTDGAVTITAGGTLRATFPTSGVGTSVYFPNECNAGSLYASTSQVLGESVSGSLRATLATKTGTTAGIAGSIAWDADYIYVCTATDTWKRVALTAF